MTDKNNETKLTTEKVDQAPVEQTTVNASTPVEKPTETALDSAENQTETDPVVPEYPRVEGDVLLLGQDIYTKKDDHSVITWRGQNYGLLSEKQAEKPVKSYTSGERVEVLKDGSWVEGMVNGIEKRLNILYVHTSRGPVTVARADGIRPLVK